MLCLHLTWEGMALLALLAALWPFTFYAGYTCGEARAYRKHFDEFTKRFDSHEDFARRASADIGDLVDWHKDLNRRVIAIAAHVGMPRPDDEILQGANGEAESTAPHETAEAQHVVTFGDPTGPEAKS